MQAIQTRYVRPTNHRGARMRAGCASGFVTLPYQDGLGSEGNHKAACDALLKKLGWSAEMVGGEYAGDTYWVFVSKLEHTK